MKLYSQKDPEWKNHKLGSCNDTIGNSGCKITSLGNMLNKTPVEVNQIMLDKGAYIKGCLSEDVSTAKALGMEYHGREDTPPSYPCIAETDRWKSVGVLQHFFTYYKGKIIDPLDTDPDWKDNNYNIVSYRLFKTKDMEFPEWSEESMQWCKDHSIMSEFTGEPIPDYRMAVIIHKAIKKDLEWTKSMIEGK